MSKNTLQKGSVRCIVFRENDTWYGVGLECNLVEEGQDPLEVLANLHQALSGYVETARKYKMRSLSLNQKPDKEYEAMWQALANNQQLDGKEVYLFGHYQGAFQKERELVAV